MKKLTLVTIILALGLTSCSEWVKEIQPEPGSTGPQSQAIPDITNNPTPGKPGPYDVCFRNYDIDSDLQARGVIYVPVTDDRSCKVIRDFPLVLIAHADGADYGDYHDLAMHLASNALVVVSFDRTGITADGPFDQLLEDHLDYLYGTSQVATVITNQIGLIGHSAGGRAVIEHAGVINDYGKQLKALIVLAPTVGDTNVDFLLAQECEAFLGLHPANDSDVTAFGNKKAGEPMESTFKYYDDAGIIKGNPNNLSLTKDMIFATSAVPDYHYFQNKDFSLAFINAFLQVHLNGHSIFNRFLKNQEKPPSLTTTVHQQHADPERLVVADFESNNKNINTLGETIEFSGTGITQTQAGWAHLLDEFSPHHTKVLRFEWNKTTQVLGKKQSGAISFALPDVDISNYRYVSFRITQVYHHQNNPNGTDRDLTVKIGSPKVKLGSGVNVSNYGGKLHFPIKMVAPIGALQEEQTKNAMRSYLIPLNVFDNVDLNKVNQVVLDFSDSGASTTTFILDDLEFYK